MLNLFSTILIICSFLILPHSSGGIAYYSPGIIISSLLYFLSLFAYILNSSFIYSKKFFTEFTLSSLFLVYSIFLAYYQGESIFIYFSKSLFLVSTLFISKLVNKKNSKVIIQSILFIFTIDLIYRLIFHSGGVNLNFYEFKNTLFFVDTNFIGLTIVPAVTILLRGKKKGIFPLIGIIIILSTLSRTTYLGIILFFSSFLKKGIRNLAYILIVSLVILFLLNPTIFNDLDGSLDTKIGIIKSIKNLDISIENVLFGFGKLGIEEIIKYSRVGHSILGIASQYGIIYLLLQFLATLLFIKKDFRDNFIFYWIFIGMFSVYPLSTIGLSIIFFNSALEECKKFDI